MTPSVSILVPVYNREPYLVVCLESALAQTVAPLEVIVVDNASTDATWSICQDFARRDARVHIFRNAENLGPGRNWQRCIVEARGELGKILFSDDFLYPDYLAQTAPYLADPDVGFVFTAVDIQYDSGDKRPAYEWLAHPIVFESDEYIRQGLRFKSVPLSPGCMLFRMRDLRANLRLNIPSPTLSDWGQYGAGPDLLLSLLTAQTYRHVAHLPKPLCAFRHHANSITVSHRHWFIYRRYQQARIWFAAEHQPPAMLAQLLAEMWLAELNNERRWLTPRQCAAQYTTRFAWSWRAVAAGLTQRLRRKASQVT